MRWDGREVMGRYSVYFSYKQKAMEESDKGIGLTKCKDIEGLFKKLNTD